MFACLFRVPPPVVPSSPHPGAGPGALLVLAREFSPRVEEAAPGSVVLDLTGMERLLGAPGTIGDRLRSAAAERGLPVHVSVAGTRMAALLLAAARPGLTVIPAGGEGAALAPLPIDSLNAVSAGEARPVLEVLRRWGIRTLGEFAALPPVSLFERLGQPAVRWQRVSRGGDPAPLVADTPEVPWESTFDLEWPVDGLEPLSFVFGRLFDDLCARLVREGRAAAVVHLALRLVTREVDTRTLQLPAPMNDPRVLRTLALLNLEARSAAAGVDRVTVSVEPTPAPVTQYSLLERARPMPEQLSTLVARLSALMGEVRVGGSIPVDSHRPGAFQMESGKDWVVAAGSTAGAGRGGRLASRVADRVQPGEDYGGAGIHPVPGAPRLTVCAAPAGVPGADVMRLALRRFRWPVPARVLVQDGRPARVTTDRRDLAGGRVESCAGPWRTSGEWWQVVDARLHARADGRPVQVGWNRDEWDVALADGAIYRIYRDLDHDRWFLDGIVD